MIRVVLAVALAVALVGVSLPVAERVERDRNTALATNELQDVARTADRLAADNDPVDRDGSPAGTVLVVDPPTPTVTDGGRIVVADDRLVWAPATGDNHSLEPAVDVAVPAGPIVVARETRLRLTLVGEAGAPLVRIERARVQEGSRDQTPRARTPPHVRRGLPV
jgi:hypothetical protein